MLSLCLNWAAKIGENNNSNLLFMFRKTGCYCLVPVAGLEPARLISNGFWIRLVYQFQHTGMWEKLYTTCAQIARGQMRFILSFKKCWRLLFLIFQQKPDIFGLSALFPCCFMRYAANNGFYGQIRLLWMWDNDFITKLFDRSLWNDKYSVLEI